MKVLVSWQTFAICVFSFCGIYYAVVFFLYYRNNLFNTRKGHQQILPQSYVKVHEQVVDTSKNVNHQSFLVRNQVHDFSAEFKALLLQSVAQQDGKETILIQVNKLLNKYSHLKMSAFSQALTNMITQELKDQCSIELSGEDQKNLWQ